MITKIHTHPCLDHFIDYYWVEEKKRSKVKILPDGSTSIIIVIDGELGILDYKGNKKKYTNTIILGATKKIIIVNKSKNTNLVGVKFKQGEAYHFFKKPMRQFTDKIIRLSNVFTNETDSLKDALLNAANNDEIRKILNNYFFRNVEAIIGETKIVTSIIRKVNISTKPLLIKDLCKSEKITNKHLISLFKKRVGLSPKLLYRINKFKKVIYAINDSKNVNWSQIAYECHYYDQAHMINEFKKFSGLSPENYLENNNAKGFRIKVL